MVHVPSRLGRCGLGSGLIMSLGDGITKCLNSDLGAGLSSFLGGVIGGKVEVIKTNSSQ